MTTVLPTIIDQLTEEASRRLREMPGTDRVAATIVAGAYAQIAQAAAVGLAVLDARGTVRTIGASTPAVEILHTSQSHLGEGPCLDALPGVGAAGTAAFTHVPDLATGGRWPRWSLEVRAAGYHEVLSFPMAGADSYAALTFYATPVGSLRRTDAPTAAVFADQLGDLLGSSRRDPTAAPATRVLHHATGILAERHGLATAQAFAVLVTVARETGQDLPDTARHVVRTPGDSSIRGA